jgi:hypothetical protein
MLELSLPTSSNSAKSTFSLAFFLFRLAIFFLPASYAIKFFMGLPDIVWLDPCLLIALVATLFYLVEVKKFPNAKVVGVGLLLVVVHFVSSFANTLFAPLWFSEEAFTAQLLLAEPIKLLLNINFFALTFVYAQDPERRRKMAYWLGWSALLQFVLAVYLVASTYISLPLPSSFSRYMQDYAFRQALWFDSLRVTRLGGTFIESPPFGLFMFGAFLVTFYEAVERRSRLFWVFASVALAGAMGSISTQVLGGVLAWGGVAVLGLLNLKRKTLERWLRNGFVIASALIALVPVVGYLVYAVASRMAIVERTLSNPEQLYGTSFGERFFHIFSVIDTVILNPLNFLFGVGSRYGFYVSHRFDVYPVTTTPQVALMDVLGASGLVGLLLFTLWLLLMLPPLLKLPKLQGLAVWLGLIVAVATQATWKWTTFFFVLAYFVAKGLTAANGPDESERS